MAADDHLAASTSDRAGARLWMNGASSSAQPCSVATVPAGAGTHAGRHALFASLVEEVEEPFEEVDLAPSADEPSEDELDPDELSLSFDEVFAPSDPPSEDVEDRSPSEDDPALPLPA
ncbi:MAG: hypothetical protein WD010_04570 [Nitriliruptor sp.]